MKKLIGVLAIIVVLLIMAFMWYQKGCEGGDCSPATPVDPSSIKSFDDCVAAGYPVMESYPRMCKVDNTTFVEKIEQP